MLVPVLCWKTQWLGGGGGGGFYKYPYSWKNVLHFTSLFHMLFLSILNLSGPQFPHIKTQGVNGRLQGFRPHMLMFSERQCFTASHILYGSF